MATKARKGKKAAAAEACTIAPAIPLEALRHFQVDPDEKTAGEVSAYVERQSDGETVTHAEVVMSERIYGRNYQCWDVRTDKGRLWVITSPTHLYDQALFPSLDYTLSFHIGLMARLMARDEPQTGMLEQIMLPAAWRKWSQAGDALAEAAEPEDFQSVGMRCRESLIAMIRGLALPAMVPTGTEAPKSADVVHWCELIADHAANGSSAARIRGYLKSIGKSAWELLNWLTHAQGATRADGVLAMEATQHVLGVFGTAMLRHRQGVPDRCEICGSYEFELHASEAASPYARAAAPVVGASRRVMLSAPPWYSNP